MLQSLHQNVNQHTKDIRGFMVGLEQCNQRINQVNSVLDREMKLKDVVNDLKIKLGMVVSYCFNLIFFQEKNMATDIKNAVENHEGVLMKITGLTNLVRDVQKERNIYISALDKIRDEIKDFENIMNE
jgi:hypothetical protein